MDKKRQSLKRFSGSSFLTPESALYLNQAIKQQKPDKLDDEMVYAGLHNDRAEKMKFKRTEKNKQRYKGRQKRSQTKKKNRHAQ